MIISGYLISILYALACIGGAGVLYKLGCPKSITRKFVHILVGFEWIILNHFMGNSPHFLAVAVALTVVLAIEYRLKIFKMMSSDADNAPGTVYYAIAMSIMSAITLAIPEMSVPFGIGVFCTSFGDGFAGLVGSTVKRANPKIYGNKTLVGALTGMTVSFITTAVISLAFSYPLTWWQWLAVAFLSSALELVFGYGLDNIAVTLGTAALAYAFVYLPTVTEYLVPILLTPLFIGFAYKKRALTLLGVVAAVAVDLAISASLGNFGFVTLAAFFVGGIAADKFKKKRKKSKQNGKKSHECRRAIQVISNGIAAAIAALLFLTTENKLFVVAFVAAMAEALADTVASGIGSSSSRVYDVLRFRRCEPGLSGGVSLSGTLSSLVASLLLPLVAIAFGTLTPMQALVAAVAAFIGVMIDSVLGSLIQAKYRCTVCGATVESREHCSVSAIRISGISLINNDAVNLLSNVITAAVAIALAMLI